MSKQESARCPECGEMIDIEQYSEIGDIIYCPHCDIELKILKLDPPKLKIAEDLEGDEFAEDTDPDAEAEAGDDELE